jgi:hypothetical protein
MSETVERNAKITQTYLGMQDNGLMTFFVALDYGGAGQAAGLYALDRPAVEGQAFPRVGKAPAATMICELLRTLEIKSWEQLPGTACRVIAKADKVVAIGNLLKDAWVNFEEINERFDHDVTGLKQEYIDAVTGHGGDLEGSGGSEDGSGEDEGTSEPDGEVIGADASGAEGSV